MTAAVHTDRRRPQIPDGAGRPSLRGQRSWHEPAVIDRNDVVLRGRLSASPELRTLPSGDTLLVFKLVVRRESPRPRGPKSDVITCVSLLPAVQRYAAAWAADDVVEVEGALQRRFWRTPTGTAVAYEVNCRRGRKVMRAGQRSPRSA